MFDLIYLRRLKNRTRLLGLDVASFERDDELDGVTSMTGKDFLLQAFEVADDLFPEKLANSQLHFTDAELELMLLELEARTGYVRRSEFR